MNFINISQFKKAQIVLRINAFLLFLFIIATPYLIKDGVWGVAESTVEGLFLAIEIGVLIRLFSNYDFYSNKNDRKANKLSGELEEQKELSVDTFKYLGKVNVQMAVVKQLVKKFKAPVERKKFEYAINEMLQTIIGLTGNRTVSFKIIDLNSYKTIDEVYLTEKNGSDKIARSISNEDLCKKQQVKGGEDLHIISSEHDNFSLKTFIMVGRGKNEGRRVINNEQLELIQNIVNQCEMMYLLFESKYHK